MKSLKICTRMSLIWSKLTTLKHYSLSSNFQNNLGIPTYCYVFFIYDQWINSVQQWVHFKNNQRICVAKILDWRLQSYCTTWIYVVKHEHWNATYRTPLKPSKSRLKNGSYNIKSFVWPSSYFLGTGSNQTAIYHIFRQTVEWLE